jgi:hypothetical protein
MFKELVNQISAANVSKKQKDYFGESYNSERSMDFEGGKSKKQNKKRPTSAVVKIQKEEPTVALSSVPS